MSRTQIAVLILAVWVVLVNVTSISDTVGWILGAAAGLLVLLDSVWVGTWRQPARREP